MCFTSVRQEINWFWFIQTKNRRWLCLKLSARLPSEGLFMSTFDLCRFDVSLMELPTAIPLHASIFWCTFTHVIHRAPAGLTMYFFFSLQFLCRLSTRLCCNSQRVMSTTRAAIYIHVPSTPTSPSILQSCCAHLLTRYVTPILT